MPAFEHWIYPLSGREKVILEFVPGSELPFTDDWEGNFALTLAVTQGRAGLRTSTLTYFQTLLASRPEHYEPDWQTLTTTLALRAGVMRIARRAPDVYPDLRTLVLGGDLMEEYTPDECADTFTSSTTGLGGNV